MTNTWRAYWPRPAPPANSTTTVFGTPNDETLAELALETFFPADAASAQYLRQLHASTAAE